MKLRKTKKYGLLLFAQGINIKYGRLKDKNETNSCEKWMKNRQLNKNIICTFIYVAKMEKLFK